MRGLAPMTIVDKSETSRAMCVFNQLLYVLIRLFTYQKNVVHGFVNQAVYRCDLKPQDVKVNMNGAHGGRCSEKMYPKPLASRLAYCITPHCLKIESGGRAGPIAAATYSSFTKLDRVSHRRRRSDEWRL